MPVYYLSVPLSDTFKFNCAPERNVDSLLTGKSVYVSFKDSFGQVHLVYHYEENDLKSFRKIMFDSAGRITSEEFYPGVGLPWTSAVKFTYDGKGKVILQDEILKDDGLRHLTYFGKMGAVKEEFYRADKLDRVLVYVYRFQ